MLPTFSVNINKYNKNILKNLVKLLKDVEKSDLTREWAGEAFLRVTGDSNVIDLNKFASACNRNAKILKEKRKQREVSILTQNDYDDGVSIGIIDSLIDSKIDIMSEVLENADLEYYVDVFLSKREFIFMDRGTDIWRVLELAKSGDSPAQKYLRQLIDEYDIREIIQYVLTKRQCYFTLEAILC